MMATFSSPASCEEKVGLRSFLGADSPVTGSRRPSTAPIQPRTPPYNHEPSQPRSSSHSRSFSSSFFNLFLPRRSSNSWMPSSTASPTSSFGSSSSYTQALSYPAPGRPASTTATFSARRGRPQPSKSKTVAAVATSCISWPLERDCEAASVWVLGYRDDGGADDRSRARKLEARVDCRCHDCGASEWRRTAVL
ncbi:hypothetical protein NBRC10512_001567 [Rhodotorula toruloides]|uniref:RHTO0S12e03708g1_1 n=2 Tax=Rhodotorula toruloides TaxID=5286 RepID=A0A061BAH7_RHOTO|nr:uncharacterized protein RHTO_07517 [Rhodotorula toruloides NP11]EMS23175.1 hypothetical protein RHTO_07517 [Rhodotorula toruloides NP11]CDR46364.1 RHTO0S12e03708g1_1 [Rhodotorula toruloides]